MAQAGSGFHTGTRVQVDGIPQLARRMRAAGADLGQMSDLMYRLGRIVIDNATVPEETSELAGSLRAGRGKTKAVVRAGYAKRAAHAGVVHYGNPNTGSRAQPFLTESLRRSQTQIITTLNAGVDQIIRTNNL